MGKVRHFRWYSRKLTVREEPPTYDMYFEMQNTGLAFQLDFVSWIGSFIPENKSNKIFWQRILLNAIDIRKKSAAII